MRPWWNDPLVVMPICLIVLLLVMLGPSMCDSLGVPRP